MPRVPSKRVVSFVHPETDVGASMQAALTVIPLRSMLPKKPEGNP